MIPFKSDHIWLMELQEIGAPRSACALAPPMLDKDLCPSKIGHPSVHSVGRLLEQVFSPFLFRTSWEGPIPKLVLKNV
jgi:hypothetical protein